MSPDSGLGIIWGFYSEMAQLWDGAMEGPLPCPPVSSQGLQTTGSCSMLFSQLEQVAKAVSILHGPLDVHKHHLVSPHHPTMHHYFYGPFPI